jgi:LysW-gamma-L-lysine carboxypeptidase
MAASATDLLEEMLRIPSPSGKEDRLAGMLHQRLTTMGFKSWRDSAGNVFGTRGEGLHEVVLLGHLDTAPGELAIKRTGDSLTGRGSVDAKGPLAAAIVAVSRQPADAPWRFTVVGAVEEESSSRGAWHLAESMPGAPAHLIVLEPSGWDAVTLGYKGSVHLRLRITQPMAHGSSPQPSAMDQAVAFIHRLQDYASHLNEKRSAFDRLDVRILSGAGSGSQDGLTDRAELHVGFRLPPGLDPAGLREDAISWVSDGHEPVTLEWDRPVLGYRASKNTPLVRAFLRAIREHRGTPRFKLKSGTADMNILAPRWGCPALAYGPGDSHLDHSSEEAIDLSELERGCDVLTSALQHLS